MWSSGLGKLPTSKLQKTWSTDQNKAAVCATSFIPIFTGICRLTQAGTRALIISGLRTKVGSFNVRNISSELNLSSENWTVALTLNVRSSTKNKRNADRELNNDMIKSQAMEVVTIQRRERDVGESGRGCTSHNP